MALTLAASIGEELLFGKFGQAQRAPIRVSHESVNHVVRVVRKSRHSPVWSDAESIGALAGSRARARNVELNDGAVLIAHKAVIHICRVNVES